jgi:hypothetical protein
MFYEKSLECCDGRTAKYKVIVIDDEQDNAIIGGCLVNVWLTTPRQYDVRNHWGTVKTQRAVECVNPERVFVSAGKVTT